MSWNLTEKEQAAIMNAVKGVLDPHLVKATGSFTITWENKDGTQEPREIPHCGFVVDKEAPPEIKALDDVYNDILARGAMIGGSFHD